MKKTILSLLLLAMLAVGRPLAAQISPAVSVQGTNATLRWASTPGESYVVVYRRAFHPAPELQWQVIGTNVPASGGIETFFQHIGGVPRLPAGYTGGGGGGGGSPPVLLSATSPATGSNKDKDDKVKAKDSELPAFPSLPDEKEIEKWLKELLKEYERQQREGGGVQAFTALMASTLTAEQATSNSMGFYIVLNAAEDLNGDGVPDGLAAQFGLNPLNDLLQTDSDGDGLTDQQEIVNGTNPFSSDTDGDGASDAAEVAAGSDPKTPHGLPGISAAFYEEAYESVGTNGNPSYYHVYREEWGVRLFQSNRLVYPSPVNGELGYTETFAWPMQYAQVQTGTSSFWKNLVGGGQAGFTQNTNFPALSTQARPPYGGYWRTGNFNGTRYQTALQLTTHGTNATLNRAYELQLVGYNVTNGVQVLVTNFTGISLGGKLLTTNGTCVMLLPENIRTNLPLTVPASMTNLAWAVTPTELTIDIQQVISDQIAGNECNRLPTAFFAGELNNPMVMGTRSGNDARLGVRLSFQNFLGANAFVGVRKTNSSTVLGFTRATNNLVKTLISFPAENGSKFYEVVAGYDVNQNGALDSNEVTTIFRKTPATDSTGRVATASLHLLDKIVVVTQADFDSAKSKLTTLNVFGTDYAGDLISAFAKGKTNVATATTTMGVPISTSTPGLALKVGAKWDSSCSDITYRFTFADGTEASDDFEDSKALKGIVAKAIKDNLAALLLAGSPSVSESAPLTFSISIDFNVTDKDPVGYNELGYAFGKVTVTGELRVRYHKPTSNSIFVSETTVSGAFDDLYDYAYGGVAGLIVDPRDGARVQAGHATLSSAAEPGGKVFFTRLEYSTGWRPHSQTYSK